MSFSAKILSRSFSSSLAFRPWIFQERTLNSDAELEDVWRPSSLCQAAALTFHPPKILWLQLILSHQDNISKDQREPPQTASGQFISNGRDMQVSNLVLLFDTLKAHYVSFRHQRSHFKKTINRKIVLFFFAQP